MSKKECTGQKLSLLHTDTKTQNIRLHLSVMGILLLTSEAPRFGLLKPLLELLLELFSPTLTDVVPPFSVRKDHEPSKLLLFLCLVKSIGKKSSLMSTSIDQMLSPVVLRFVIRFIFAYKVPQVSCLQARWQSWAAFIYNAWFAKSAVQWASSNVSLGDCNKGMQAR